MDPNSGEILAEASYPNFDLNNPRDLTPWYTTEALEKMSDDDKLNDHVHEHHHDNELSLEKFLRQ